MENRIEIPEGVVDEKEYRKAMVLKNHPVMKNTIFVASNGVEINIAMLPHRLKERIADLSPKEQEEILDMKAKWQAMRGKISVAQAKAFGRAGCTGGKGIKKGTVFPKISPFESDIVGLLGRLFTIEEVVRIMHDDNGIQVSVDDVKEVIRKYAVQVEKQREEFRNKLVDVRLYNKRPRLEELAWLYNKMKYRFIAFNGIDAYNCLLRTLEQIRKESEGDILNINASLDVNIEAVIQDHIQNEILRTINLKEVILGRVAARMNYDVKKLVAGLHNSYYAKFIDISGMADENATMVYPSSSAYDFAEIERNAERAEEVMDVEAEEVKPEESARAAKIKSIFLEKIRSQRKEQEQKTTVWDLSAKNENEASDVMKPVDRSTLGRGRRKDDVLPSRMSKNKSMGKKDYYDGGRIEK
jgi:hypothetical protein